MYNLCVVIGIGLLKEICNIEINLVYYTKGFDMKHRYISTKLFDNYSVAIRQWK